MQIGIPEIERKYEILAKLGEGGMGAVYKARHRLLDESRVIKTIRPHLQQDEDLRARFKREARVAAKLRHPNVAVIHDFSMAEDGTASIVMEYIEGWNLRDLQRSGRQLAVNEVVEIGCQVLDALAYLHGQGFVHRDISTDNMMVHWGKQGRPVVKLIDLGLAKSLEGEQWQTRTGTVVGKVRYISPEQLNRGMPGVVIDERCDLYSFGVVLYELLTNALPIVGDDDMSLIAGHLHRPPRPFEETDPGAKVPPALRAVVMRALEKNPDDRYANAGELKAALARAGDGETAEPPELDEQAPTLVLDTGGTEAPTLHVPSAEIRARAADYAQTAAAKVGARRRPPRWLLAVLLSAAVLGGWWLGVARPWQDVERVPTAGTGAAAGDAAALADVFFGAYHALVIGNDDYRLLPRLETAVHDARRVARLLEDRYGFQVELHENLDRKATIDALFAARARLTARDNLLVYYAGHGQLGAAGAHWLPIDAEPDSDSNWISTRYEVSELLGASAAKHILVIADSCYAGTPTTAPLATPEPEVEGESRREQIERLVNRPSRLVLTSGGLAPVLDTGDGFHSVFARALIDVLEGNGEVIEASRLFAALQPRVTDSAARLGFEQTPTLVAIPESGDRGGEMFFVPASS